MPDFVGPTSVIAILGIFVVPWLVIGAVIIVAIHRGHENKKMEHRERMRALELGYDVPADPPRRKGRYPYAWPFVFMGFGLALLLIWIFTGFDEGGSLGFGLISFFIGLGLFLSRRHGIQQEEMAAQEAQLRDGTWKAPESSEPAAPAPAPEAGPQPEEDIQRFAPPGSESEEEKSD